jgi:hypothetical protein
LYDLCLRQASKEGEKKKKVSAKTYEDLKEKWTESLAQHPMQGITTGEVLLSLI